MSEIIAEIKLIANITKEDKDIVLGDLKDIVKYKPQYKNYITNLSLLSIKSPIKTGLKAYLSSMQIYIKQEYM